MKIAVIGNHIQGIKLAYYFEQQGAAVKIFTETRPNSTELAVGQQWEWLVSQGRVSDKRVLRVHKRFLAKDETLERSRLCDLFRVVYAVNPQEVNPELKEKFATLAPEVIQTLRDSLEGYEDFDLIIDAPDLSCYPAPAGYSSFAVGEKILRKPEMVSYYPFALEDVQEFKTSDEVALVINDLECTHILTQLLTKLNNNELQRVFLISHYSSPLQKLLQNDDGQLKLALEFGQQILDQQITEFKLKLAAWEQLESYEKAKVVKPEAPIPALVIFAAHNITVMDQLVDQNKLFLTCEIPEFRHAQEQKENGVIDLKTIGVNHLYVCNGYRLNNTFYEDLTADEVGFYRLQNLNKENTMNIITDIESFFKKRE